MDKTRCYDAMYVSWHLEKNNKEINWGLRSLVTVFVSCRRVMDLPTRPNVLRVNIKNGWNLRHAIIKATDLTKKREREREEKIPSWCSDHLASGHVCSQPHAHAERWTAGSKKSAINANLHNKSAVDETKLFHYLPQTGHITRDRVELQSRILSTINLYTSKLD